MKRYEILKNLIFFNNFKTFVEVGVADGVTSEYILKHIKDPDLKVWGIDPYEDYDDHKGGVCSSKVSLRGNKEKMHDRLCGNMRYTHIYESSHNAKNYFGDESVDLVFIDGDHSYLSVKEDIEDWWGKVKKGGIISGHDFKHKPCYGVIPAVREFAKKFNLEVIKRPDHVWVIYKL